MKAPGRIVQVNDTYMHVFSISTSSTENTHTIVFLAGSGTECPTYDFKTLWHLLINDYSIVIVERPGYGWSGQTKCPRDIDTILEETREALRQANIEGPFIPAAHSLSGLEAIYWAQKYPDEISAIIGLDMAVPQVYHSMEKPKFLPLMARVGHIFRKPISAVRVKRHEAVKLNLLDDAEQAAMQYIMAEQLLSRNMIDEIDYVKNNARKVADGECPHVPFLCYLSTDKGVKKTIPSWGKAQREYFSSNTRAHFIELSCGHYVHNEEPEMIAKSIVRLHGNEIYGRT